MFKGIYEHQLDDKNRLRIPARFRKELTGEHGEKTYCFFRGMNNCICVMEESLLEEALKPLLHENVSDSTPGSTMLFGYIFPAEEDSQGRVVLPTLLKKFAGIQKDIVTVGHGKRLEIWATDKYYKYIEDANYDEQLKLLRF